MPAIPNPRHEAFAVRRVAAVLNGETPKQSYIAIYGEGHAGQAETRSRNLLKRPEVIARIEEMNTQASMAAMRARTDAISKEAFDDLLWKAINTPVSEIDEDTPFADMSLSKSGEGIAVKPSFVGMMNTLGKSKGFLRSKETNVHVIDWSATYSMKDVTPRPDRLEE